MRRMNRRKNLNRKGVNIVKKLIAIMAIVSFGLLAGSVAFAVDKVHYLVDVEYDGALVVEGDITLGDASVNDGQIDFLNATNANTVTIKSGATSGSYSLTLPVAQCDTTGKVLTSTDAGVLSWVAQDGDTTYTAGDGLDLVAEEFSLDLKANSGLTIDTTELAVLLDGSTLVMGASGIKVDTVSGVTGANEDNLGDDDLDALQNVGELSEAKGDVLIYNTSWIVLVKGTEGQVLKMGGADLPVWGTDNTGITAYDDIDDPDGSGSITMGVHTGTYTSGVDEWGGMIIENTQAELTTSEAFLLSLKYTDDGEVKGIFIRGLDNAGNDTQFSIGAGGKYTFGLGESLDNDSDGYIAVTGKFKASDDIEIPEAKKVIFNNDDVGDSYIVANADDTVSFWRQGTEYMRFE